MVRSSYSHQKLLCFLPAQTVHRAQGTVHCLKTEHTDFLSSSAATRSEGGFSFQICKSKKVKQTYFHWRFKVCALNSSLLTTNFVHAFHRDLQTAGKNKRKNTLKHSATAATQISILWMNVTESLFTKIIKLHFLQEGKGIFTTTHSATPLLSCLGITIWQSIQMSGLPFLMHFKIEVTDQKTMKILKMHYCPRIQSLLQLVH